MNDMIEKLRLTVGEVLSPDLLRKDWRLRMEKEHHTYGHCYVAAEALYHLIGGIESVFEPRYAKYYDKDDQCWCTHWWLYSSKLKSIYDPTKEQYTFCGVEPPYHNKRTSGFLTKHPSKRAVIVMNRVKEKIGCEIVDKIKDFYKNKNNFFDE